MTCVYEIVMCKQKLNMKRFNYKSMIDCLLIVQVKTICPFVGANVRSTNHSFRTHILKQFLCIPTYFYNSD